MEAISSRPLFRAQALSKAMPHHSFGLPAAMRVVSLKPPAASRMIEPVSSACALASCMREEATMCGT